MFGLSDASVRREVAWTYHLKNKFAYKVPVLRPVLNLIFYHFNCSERLLKSHNVFLVPVVAACSQLLSKSISKLFENVEWSNSLLRHFKIQTLLKISCNMAAISDFGVT